MGVSGLGQAEPEKRMPAMYVLVTMIAALLASVSLWYPSAAIGIGLCRLAGQPTYFTPAGLAPFVGVSILGLFLPAGLLWLTSGRDGTRRQAVIVGSVITTWQVTWAAIALISQSEELIAWPSYAPPADSEPWNPSLVLATGLLVVGACAALLTWAMSRRRELQTPA
jgi:hypothetical protein